ncbi:MAG: helix-turn-helix transcriptional regulator [bacterium]|nr:helix-turn-helix transcriptional regulator [bacterium]
MISAERELDRYLTLLRNKIREKGFTQLEVQEALGWGRSYISQLVTKQKSLRLEQVLSILHVIGIEPRSFFGELYGAARTLGGARLPEGPKPKRPVERLGRLTALLQGLTELLLKRGLITRTELSQAVAEQGTEEV